MAQPSVVSRATAPSSSAECSVMPSVQEPDSGSYFDETLYAAPTTAHFDTPATNMFLQENHNDTTNQAHSLNLSSHSLHSEPGQPEMTSSTFTAKLDRSPQYYEFNMPSADQHQMRQPLDQPGTSSPQLQQQQSQQQPSLLLPASSPQSSLELSSIQIEKNRESLKHKLSHRASIRELVNRGIYPSPRIPVAHAEQRRKLERAKTGDILRHHIQSRPNREYLVGQNILHGDSHVDFRIAARQKELKKCRLAENLNQHLVTRPGPLDLVDRNILEAPQQLHVALRAGLLPTSSKTTTDGASDSQHSAYYPSIDAAATLPSPAAFVFDPVIATGPTVVHAAPATTTAIPMILSSNQQLAVYTPLNTLSGVVTSPAPSCDYVILQQPEQTQTELASQSFSSGSTGSVNNATSVLASSKKAAASVKTSKGSSATTQRSKSQTLKFHEYKGPPEVVKASKQQSTEYAVPPARRLHKSDTAAREHLKALIDQQCLYLKYQKMSSSNGSPSAPTPNPGNHQQASSTSSALSLSPMSASSSPTASSSAMPRTNSSMSTSAASTHPHRETHASSDPAECSRPSGNSAVDRIVTRQTLADLRVSDLRSYCRQLGLPISGTKQTLVDRLDARLSHSLKAHDVSTSQIQAGGPFHSSSALYFDESMTGSMSGSQNSQHRPGVSRYEDADEVITISSSASSPGILHEQDTPIAINSHAWSSTAEPQTRGQDLNSDQLQKLHNRVESQQRHIEQLKAELELERQKRMDEGPSSMATEVPSEATPINLDEWTETVYLAASSGHQPELRETTRDSISPPSSSHQNGIGELDDIMDLIGSFSDINASHNGHSPFVMASESMPTMLKSPCHMSDFGLPNASTSPMSPWLFENEPLGFTSQGGGNGLLEQSGQAATASVGHSAPPVMGEYFTQSYNKHNYPGRILPNY